MPINDPALRALTREQLLRAGRRVIAWRHAHDKTTQRALAGLAGVSVGAIQSLESGARITRLEILEKIAGVLETSLEALIAEEGGAGAIDPRLANLLPESVDVAEMYQTAGAELKMKILQALREYHAEARGQRGGISPASASNFLEHHGDTHANGSPGKRFNHG
jgi:Helix-turn-helix.